MVIRASLLLPCQSKTQVFFWFEPVSRLYFPFVHLCAFAFLRPFLIVHPIPLLPPFGELSIPIRRRRLARNKKMWLTGKMRRKINVRMCKWMTRSILRFWQ
jgi:hypothetical protein